MSGMQQGASAVRAALADAGLSWADMQFAYGGSQDAGNADSLVNELGLTGLQFTNIWNGCATGGSSLHAAYSAIKSGEYDLGVVVGFDKHPRGAFNPQPNEWGLDDWYGETGLMLTTQFFALKTQRYMHDHGITEDALIRVSEKAFTNGSLTPTGPELRRDCQLGNDQRPTAQIYVLQPRRRRRGTHYLQCRKSLSILQ
jgi:acetyl-CoA acetyltransferase